MRNEEWDEVDSGQWTVNEDFCVLGGFGFDTDLRKNLQSIMEYYHLNNSEGSKASILPGPLSTLKHLF